MASNEVVVQRGSVARQEFGAQEIQSSAETSMAAVTAREQAVIQAEYLMAERHPRKWMDVRARMMDHCARPRFAEVSRYKKPVGKKFQDGAWVEQFAYGFTVRFAETLAQEMGNVKPQSSITYEDDVLRIVRIGVTDLQRNVPWSREVTFAKTVERKGRRRKGSQTEWDPPEGREVISVRANSYGEPTYLVKATEDELRAKVNSELSKTQRDFLIKLTPRDLLEDWEDAVYTTLDRADKADPQAALKRWLDSFHRAGIEPSDLEQFFGGKRVTAFGQAEIAELRELAQAIKEGQTTFQEALRNKFDQPLPAQGREETIARKIDDLRSEATAKPSAPAPDPPRESGAPQSASTTASASTTPTSYESWEAWEQAGAPVLPLLVIRTGTNNGTFVPNEVGNYMLQSQTKPVRKFGKQQ